MFRWFISLFEKSWSMLSTFKVVTLLKGIAHVVWLTRGRFICWLALCRSTIHHSRSLWQRLRLPWWDWWKKLIDIPSGCVFCFFKAAMCCMHCTVIPKENIYNGYISGDESHENPIFHHLLTPTTLQLKGHHHICLRIPAKIQHASTKRITPYRRNGIFNQRNVDQSNSINNWI